MTTLCAGIAYGVLQVFFTVRSERLLV